MTLSGLVAPGVVSPPPSPVSAVFPATASFPPKFSFNLGVSSPDASALECDPASTLSIVFELPRDLKFEAVGSANSSPPMTGGGRKLLLGEGNSCGGRGMVLGEIDSDRREDSMRMD